MTSGGLMRGCRKQASVTLHGALRAAGCCVFLCDPAVEFRV